MLSLLFHPHVVQNLNVTLVSVELKRRYFKKCMKVLSLYNASQWGPMLVGYQHVSKYSLLSPGEVIKG